MSRQHVFDSSLQTASAWLEQLEESLDLPATDRHRALHALRAGLHAIRDRLPAAEVVDLAAQLPTLIRGIYYEGWTLKNDPTRIRSREAMVARVRAELAPDVRLDPVDVLRGVIELLVEHVAPGEIHDVVATLPRPIASLWQDLTGHGIDMLDLTRPKRPRLTRRTGYSR
jgi:uncharacterized protein (DUF2267 family)